LKQNRGTSTEKTGKPLGLEVEIAIQNRNLANHEKIDPQNIVNGNWL
jgi:hypothetical protein